MTAWEVEFHDRCETEFDEWPEAVQEDLLAHAGLLGTFDPSLGRPHAHTLEGSAYAKMKELRFYAADGVWRVAFAFGSNRRAILLAGGDKRVVLRSDSTSRSPSGPTKGIQSM